MKSCDKKIACSLLFAFYNQVHIHIDNGFVDKESRCGAYAKLVNDVLTIYKKYNSNIKFVSSLITIEDFLDFLNNDILQKLSIDCPDRLRRDWNGDWELLED